MSDNKEKISEINRNIENEKSNINSMAGFEVICEAMVYKIYDIFGRNSLLSMLYQVGAGPGETIANRLQEKYGKETFEPLEAFELLLKELGGFYSIQIKDIEEDEAQLRLIIENYCFLREPLSHREKLKPGKAFCRINKGYFEVALKKLVGDRIQRIEINFLEDDPEKDICIEEIIFHK